MGWHAFADPSHTMAITMARARRRQPKPAADGELLDLTVSEIGAQGDGIAQHGAAEIFVPYTLPGDRVVARRIGPHHAVPESWTVRAEAHHAPPCVHFTACGGCALQHLDDDAYADWKWRQIDTALARRGLTADRIAPMARTAPGERRRADFAVMHNGGQIEIGFHAYKSRALVDMQACAVLDPRVVAILPALRGLARVLVPDRRAADLLVTYTESGLDLLIGRVPALDRAQREAVSAYAAANDIARVAWRQASETPEIIIQRRVPQVTFAGVAVDLPPGAFLQASKTGENAIVAAVANGVGNAKRVADLYAGCGTLTFPLARGARVRAVEGAKDLSDALGAAARRSGRASRVTVETRDLARRPLLANELADFDAVVFDPPRDGALAQTEEIARSHVKIVVGVSCNPATFARDARVLVDAGYHLTEITPVDQFLWSPHLELVALFTR